MVNGIQPQVRLKVKANENPKRPRQSIGCHRNLIVEGLGTHLSVKCDDNFEPYCRRACSRALGFTAQQASPSREMSKKQWPRRILDGFALVRNQLLLESVAESKQVLLPLLLSQDEPNSGHWIALARQTVEHVVLGGPAPVTKGSEPAKGVFVTIERDGTILGCRGTLSPTKKTLQDEIVAAATGAAKFDPRYGPVKKEKLGKFLVTVTVVDRLISIDTHEGLRPEEGLVLRSGSKTGVVLPWEGKDAAIRLSWAYKKAGVQPGTTVSLMKMIAERYRG